MKLVLSGGGTRGVLIHAGFVQALLDAGVRIDALAGTSAGALVAYATAVGASPAEVALDALAPTRGAKPLARRGLYAHRGYPYLYPSGGVLRLLRALERPFVTRSLVVYTSNLSTRREHVWRSYEHPHAPWPWVVLASMSIPFVFQPIRIFGQDHVDGGLTSNFALDAFGDDPSTRGVYIDGGPKTPSNPLGVRAYVGAIVSLAINANVREDIEDADAARTLRIPATGASLSFDYGRAEALRLIDHGRAAALASGWIR